MKSSQDWYYSDCTSGIIGTGDYKAWLDDFVEATNDYGWDDKNRAKWFSQFLTGITKVSADCNKGVSGDGSSQVDQCLP